MSTPAGTVQVGRIGRPAPAPPTLVVLHGYGADERDLMTMLPVLGMMLPGDRRRRCWASGASTT